MEKMRCECGAEFEPPEEGGEEAMCPECGRSTGEILGLEPVEDQPEPVDPARAAGRDEEAPHVVVVYDEPPPSFWSTLPRVPLYPFTRSGIAMLVTGTAFLYALDVLVMLPLFGWIGLLFFLGYLCAYWMDVVATSAVGEDEPPDWPDLAHVFDDIVQQCFLFLATVLLCLVPFFVALSLESRLGSLPGSRIPYPFSWACAGVGMRYLPVALSGVSIYRSLSGARPRFVLRAMIQLPGQYYFAATCFFFGAWLLIGGWAAAFIGGWRAVFGSPIMLFLLFAQAPGFYILLLSGRVMGRFYWCNREVLEGRRSADH